MNHKTVTIGSIRIGHGHPLAFIAGPCVIENESDTLRAADKLRKTSDAIGIPLIFKSSYDKANRTSMRSFRGPGITEGLRILAKVRQETGLPVLSDVHSPEEAQQAAEHLDVLQLPALLSRQTDLIVAASKTKKPVNIKKGQFMAPEDMENVIEKVRSSGNEEILVTERGVSFGYHNLIVDMRSFPILRGFGCPVVFDATHSVQLPSGQGSASGGQREFIGPLARSAVAAGCDAVFMEVHEDPDRAPCDGPNMLPLRDFGKIAERLSELHNLIRGWQ